MRKIIWITSSLLIVTAIVIIVVKQNFNGSPDYNFITAKLDIKNGNARIINSGHRIPSIKDSEIDEVAAKYGFTNIYIGYDTAKQKMKGIKNYNELIETYLNIRNGNNWRKVYQREVDSLYKLTVSAGNDTN